MEAEKVRTINIRTLVDKYGYSKLSALTGRSRSQLSQWANNSPNSRTKKPQSISGPSCRMIEKSIGLTSGWMDILHTDNDIENIKTLDKDSHEVPNRVVPIFERPEWTEVGQQKSPTGWIVCPVACGEHTYALKVRDNSMLNPNGNESFCAGDIVYIDPDEQAVDGDFVFATSSHYKMSSIKQFIIQEEKKFLYTSNPSWQRQWIEIDDSIKLHGVIIAKVRNIK